MVPSMISLTLQGGYVTRIAGGSVTWSSKKIKSVCMSSTEAEYIAASEAVMELEWLHELFQYMNSKIPKSMFYIDSEPGIKVAKNPVFHSKTKHIPIRYHKIRNAAGDGLIEIKYVNTKDQVADILTKPLPSSQFTPLRDVLLSEVHKIINTQSTPFSSKLNVINLKRMKQFLC